MNKFLLPFIAIGTFSVPSIAAPVYKQDGQSLDIGGRVEARASIHSVKKDNKHRKLHVTDKSRARLNIKGKTQLTDELVGFGFTEFQIDTADSSKIDTRKLYVGIGSQYGAVSYGKNDGALGIITDFTDVGAYHGADAGNKTKVADRIDNQLVYEINQDLFTVKANYHFNDHDKSGIGNGFALSTIIKPNENFNFGLGYSRQDNEAPLKKEYHSTNIMVGSSYKTDLFYVGALYSTGNRSNCEQYSGYELAAKYYINQLDLGVIYNYGETDEAGIKNIKYVDQYILDATYHFQPNFKVYASYKINSLDKKFDLNNGKYSSAGDEFALGARYSF